VSFETILYEKKEAVAYVTLNRPAALNTYNMQMRDDLFEVLCAVRDDPDLRVMIVSGAGKMYCAGWQIEGVSVPVKGHEGEREGAHHGIDGLHPFDRVPPNLLPRPRVDACAECRGDQLRTQANAQHGNAAVGRLTDQILLGPQERVAVRLVHSHRAAHDDEPPESGEVLRNPVAAKNVQVLVWHPGLLQDRR